MLTEISLNSVSAFDFHTMDSMQDSAGSTGRAYFATLVWMNTWRQGKLTSQNLSQDFIYFNAWLMR